MALVMCRSSWHPGTAPSAPLGLISKVSCSSAASMDRSMYRFSLSTICWCEQTLSFVSWFVLNPHRLGSPCLIWSAGVREYMLS